MRTMLAWIVAAVVTVASMAPAPAAGRRPADTTPAAAPISGALEVVDDTSIVGWIASDKIDRVRVELRVDGRIVPRVRLDRRFDVEAALGTGGVVVGFSAVLGRSPRVSVCLDVVSRRTRTGIECRYLDSDAFVAASPRPRVVAGCEGPIIDYSVHVEGRTELHPEQVAAVVDEVLADRRSWIAEQTRRFRRVGAERAELRILVASPATVDRLCAPLATVGYLSCRQGNQVILNVNRWNEAVPFWTAGLDEYRAYLVNHEVGHYLGRGHVGCPGAGLRAPVMQQQTKGLQGCRPNGWPYPDA